MSAPVDFVIFSCRLSSRVLLTHLSSDTPLTCWLYSLWLCPCFSFHSPVDFYHLSMPSFISRFTLSTLVSLNCSFYHLSMPSFISHFTHLLTLSLVRSFTSLTCWFYHSTVLSLHLPVDFITRPVLSFISRFTLSAVGMNLVISPITFLIWGLACIVAVVSSSTCFCRGLMMLGGALRTFGFTVRLCMLPGGGGNPGGGTPGGGRSKRGIGIPTKTTLHHNNLKMSHLLSS